MNELILFFLHLNIPFLPLLLSFVYFSFVLFFSPSSIFKNSPSLSLPPPGPPSLFLSLLFSDHRSFLSSTSSPTHNLILSALSNSFCCCSSIERRFPWSSTNALTPLATLSLMYFLLTLFLFFSVSVVCFPSSA
ncbi:MAG: hypothetical protein JOS17DRAFT_546759 [Linnemannia elongata]|nr:MAG: hypothetical protein JOS17DRAFT_546759 [Linnemannia elongata]